MQGLKSKAKVTSVRVSDVGYSIRSLQAATAVEYALLVGFIATATVLAVGLLGPQLIPGFQAATAGL
ncbi:Flp family type IVb pilin [Arthrobacter sp. 2YAF22_2]